jgi:hypothetical protein
VYQSPPPSRALTLLKRTAVLLLVMQAVLAGWSGYRAVVQVLALDLTATPVLGEGATIRADVLSSARTFVTLRLEIVQGDRVSMLGTRVVGTYRDAALDPRVMRESLDVRLSRRDLAGFQPGVATVRAVATGRSQSLRVPPPTIRTIPVRIDD